MSARQIATAALTGAMLLALSGPRLAEASYGFLPQLSGGDATTTGPNQTNVTVNSYNGGKSFGSMASQAAGSIAITGGSINGTSVGATTPGSVASTTLSSSTSTTLGGTLSVSLRTITAGASYAMAATDNVVDINKATGSATAITLPPAPVNGQQVEIKDKKGDAATNNITVSATSGNIDGQPSVVLATAYVNGVFRFDGIAGTWSLY